MVSAYKALSKGTLGSSTQDAPAKGVKKNKQRVLILSSRGATHRHRHLLTDLTSLLPHARREFKFDSKSKLYQLCELAELYNCNNVVFFETRKSQDLYIWVSCVPNGPSVKFHCVNLHTMDELHFTGNSLKGSRPILSFDSTFDKEPYLRVIKDMFLRVFGVPPQARKSKPFVDRVMSFSVVDNKIWVRNYEIQETEKTKSEGDGNAKRDKDTDISLSEIGPRFVLSPIIIQESSFGGAIIYENKRFVSPNQVRSDLRRARAVRHKARVEHKEDRKQKKSELRQAQKPKDGLENRDLFA